MSVRLTSTASADEPQVVELGDLILHQSRRISQLGAAVLIVTSANGHKGAVAHLAESHDLECHRESLVGPPMRGQNGADQVRRSYAQNPRRISLGTKCKRLLANARLIPNVHTLYLILQAARNVFFDANLHFITSISISWKALSQYGAIVERNSKATRSVTCSDQLAGMLADKVAQGPLGEDVAGHLSVGVSQRRDARLRRGGRARSRSSCQLHPATRATALAGTARRATTSTSGLVAGRPHRAGTASGYRASAAAAAAVATAEYIHRQSERRMKHPSIRFTR